jgi:hypothetical protein
MTERTLESRQPLGVELSVCMHTFELNDAPPFQAISYTWGAAYCNPL